MSLEGSPGYKRLVRKGARMMARILNNTSEASTSTIHALAENGELKPDLVAQIMTVAADNPERDIVIYVQRFDPRDLIGQGDARAINHVDLPGGIVRVGSMETAH